MGRVWDWLRRVAADEVKACRERVRPFNLDLWWNELFVFGLIAFVGRKRPLPPMCARFSPPGCWRTPLAFYCWRMGSTAWS